NEEGGRDWGRDITAGRGYFRRNLTLIAAACRQAGAEPVFLTQPALRDRLGEGAFQAKVAADFTRYNQSILETAAELQALAIDVDAATPQEPALFIDAVHQTPEGVRRFTETLYPPLAEALRRRESRR
ncbi:MAG: hypothetical protein HQL51_12230, partial [Magnetococcales bacterium]|nr:hypothetical protein [Magnetococcales bacterium]